MGQNNLVDITVKTNYINQWMPQKKYTMKKKQG